MSGQLQIDGPDGGGKSTLISHLRTSVPIIKASEQQHRHVIAGESWMSWIFYQLRTEGPAIYDRFYPSQVVYPVVFNREGLSLEQHWAVEGWSLAKGGGVVICTPPLEVVWENVKKGTHLIADNETVMLRSRHILDEFIAYGERAAMPVMFYDYTSGHEQIVLDWMEQHLMMARSVDGGTGVGNPHSNLILVGDERRVGSSGPKEDLPFAGEAKLSSGVYLWRALESAKVSIRDAYITNSYEQNRRITLLEELEQVGERDLWDVVALGKIASERLTTVGVEHRRVPHPQWWRRFKFDCREEYGQLIRGDA